MIQQQPEYQKISEYQSKMQQMGRALILQMEMALLIL